MGNGGMSEFPGGKLLQSVLNTIDRNHASDSSAMQLKGGFIRVGVATTIPALLHEHGLDPGAIIAEAGLAPDVFDFPDHAVPFAALGRLVNICASKTGFRHFGLLTGQRGGTSSLGTVGLLLQQARDVGSALRDLVQYLHLHDRGAVLKLDVREGTAALTYAVYQPDFEGVDQIIDGAMAVGFNIMRGLCGPDWLPSEVRLPHRKPPNATPFHQFFQAPVRFDDEEAALIFPAHWLVRPVAGANQDLHRSLEHELQRLDACSDHDLLDETRRVLRMYLLDRRCSAEQVAQFFAVHRRTLNRRLRRQGTGFHRLLDETKFQIARRLMSDTCIPMAQIAAVLNYSEASAFTRAFRRWSGLSPTEWRNRGKGAQAGPDAADMARVS